MTTKHLHLDLFVDFQQKVSKVFQVPHTKEKQCALLVILISSKIPSEIKVAPRAIPVDTVDTVDTVYTVDTV